jgi:hypothetical protein
LDSLEETVMLTIMVNWLVLLLTVSCVLTFTVRLYLVIGGQQVIIGSRWSVEKLPLRKTSTTKKEQMWKVLSNKKANAGVAITQNTEKDRVKIAQVEANYNKSDDSVSINGQGSMKGG